VGGGCVAESSKMHIISSEDTHVQRVVQLLVFHSCYDIVLFIGRNCTSMITHVRVHWIKPFGDNTIHMCRITHQSRYIEFEMICNLLENHECKCVYYRRQDEEKPCS
jgi:hypothetical protein